MDVWRSAGDQFVRSWEDRFAIEEGLERILGDAIAGFMERQGIGLRGTWAKLALYAPDGRRHAQLARQLGFAPEQVQDGMFGRLGNTGAAFVPMLLASALGGCRFRDNLSSPHPTVMAATSGFPRYGSGQRTGKSWRRCQRITSTPAMHWTATRPTPAGVTCGLPMPRPAVPQAQSPSVSALWREGDRNVRFYGATCNQCGFVQYPPSASVREVPGPRRLHPAATERPARKGVHLLHGLPGRNHRHAAGHSRGGLRWRGPRPVHDHRPGAGRNSRSVCRWK